MLDKRDILKVESVLMEAIADWLQMRANAMHREDYDEYNRLDNVIYEARGILKMLRYQDD